VGALVRIDPKSHHVRIAFHLNEWK
jgi:hypothetical protein